MLCIFLFALLTGAVFILKKAIGAKEYLEAELEELEQGKQIQKTLIQETKAVFKPENLIALHSSYFQVHLLKLSLYFDLIDLP